MIRNPLKNSEGNPELNDEEKILFACDLCGIEFGNLRGNGSLFVTTQRIIWINRSGSDNICYSFSSSLTQLMVHALCKESNPPYLFLQIEHQDDEIRILHESYDILQKVYDALCCGQKLNPCDEESDDGHGNDAFISMDEKEYEQQKMDQISKIWDNKLKINNNKEMVNNNGYLEDAAIGQFDDVENDYKVIGNKSNNNQDPSTESLNKKDLVNPYLDQDIVQGFNEQFAPKHNEMFENKFKTHRDLKDKESVSNNQ